MWVANALGVLLLASFLANMVSIGIQSKILSLPPIAKTPLDGDGVATEAFRPDLAYYNVITDRDLFGSHATAGEGLQQVPLEPIKVSTLRIQLVGTLEGPPFYARAVIRDQGTGEVNIYRIGDMIQGQAKLILVDRARIVIERNGQQEEVVIYENEAQGAPAAPPPQPAAPPTMGGPPGPPPPGGPSPQVREVSPNRYELDRKEVDAATENMGQLMTQARVIPNLVMNKIDGYRIFAITPGSLYEKIGLKDGDVINRVNGDDISTPEKALGLFQRLKTDNYFQMDVTRNGQRQTLSYSIR